MLRFRLPALEWEAFISRILLLFVTIIVPLLVGGARPANYSSSYASMIEAAKQEGKLVVYGNFHSDIITKKMIAGFRNA